MFLVNISRAHKVFMHEFQVPALEFSNMLSNLKEIISRAVVDESAEMRANKWCLT